MPRGKPPKVIRPVLKNISLPEDLVARVELELYSELEGRVPHGAWARLVERLLREHLDRRHTAAEEHTHCCKRCNHPYTPVEGQSEDCPKCGNGC